jgi:hypothetical protein
MKITATISAIVFTLIMAYSSIAQAEGEKLKDKLSKGTITLTAEIQGCDKDAKKYCPGLEPGSQKAFLCMMAYEDKLSPSCKLGIEEAAMSLKMGAMAIDYSISACEADADKYCLDVQPGEGRLIGCIRQHEARVSQECITALKDTGLWSVRAK